MDTYDKFDDAFLKILNKHAPFKKVLLRAEVATRGVLLQKGVFKNFAKFKGKYLLQSLLFNKIISPRGSTLLRKRLWRRCLPVNLTKFLRTIF